MSSLYARVFAKLYDVAMAVAEKRGMRDARVRTLAHARGKVLEIGAGTGVNEELYPDAVDDVVLCEPDEPMARRLEDKHPGRTVVRAPAERLPFEDGTFDTVVSTLVLCTVSDLDTSLREIARVLKPDGALLFLEHVRNDGDARLAGWQDRLHRPWKAIGHGCNCNRRTVPAIRAAGFGLDGNVEHVSVTVPVFMRPVVSGRASAPAPAA